MLVVQVPGSKLWEHRASGNIQGGIHFKERNDCFSKAIKSPSTKKMAFVVSASNQKFALEGKILKAHLQGLRAETNTLVK